MVRLIEIMSLTKHLILAFILLPLIGCTQSKDENSTENMSDTKNENPYYSRTDSTKLNVTNAEWKKVLPEDVYYIAREKGTEPAFTGKVLGS